MAWPITPTHITIGRLEPSPDLINHVLPRMTLLTDLNLPVNLLQLPIQRLLKPTSTILHLCLVVLLLLDAVNATGGVGVG